MKYYCNPVNVNYRYQFNMDSRSGGKMEINREAADPSMICFEEKYYIFASMTLGVWVSDDLVHWENHKLPKELPLYDYAPDVRVMNGWVYFCASRREKNCDRYRTRDIVNGPYERIEGTFPFWDPNLFIDDDGRVYFYWGCSNTTPIWGTELDPETMNPIGETRALISGDPWKIGFERGGEDHSRTPATEEEIEVKFQAFLKAQEVTEQELPAEDIPMIKGRFSRMPYIEGAWMDKHDGRYYLQYAFPGTQYNIYGDGVYVSDSPLGPFTLAENNPFSYKPGGFLPGAGHGSSMEDMHGNWWHAATMRISAHHIFERRVGLWPAGFDKDGEMFCNQRYGDWPLAVSGLKEDPWRDPAWMLLSAGKDACASSNTEGHVPELATEENVQTWWEAASASRDEWLMIDLKKAYDVHAVQINFADGDIDIPVPGEITPGVLNRYIDDTDLKTRWKLEASADGEKWFVLEDKSEAETDLTHDFILLEKGCRIRYLKLSNMAVPYEQKPCISALRVFGLDDGAKPKAPAFIAARTGELDMEVTIADQPDTVGYNILFGSAPDKLYHSYMIFRAKTQRIGALVKGREYYVRVDAFNESGITEGTCIKLT